MDEDLDLKRKQEWQKNAGRYYDAVGRLAVASATVEHFMTMSLPAMFMPENLLEATGAARQTPEFVAALANADAQVQTLLKKKKRPTYADLISAIVDAAKPKLPTAWADHLDQVRKELIDLAEVRHEHVHRVMMLQDVDASVLLLRLQGDARGRVDPDIDGMLATAGRIFRLGHHLMMVCLSWPHADGSPPQLPTGA